MIYKIKFYIVRALFCAMSLALITTGKTWAMDFMDFRENQEIIKEDNNTELQKKKKQLNLNLLNKCKKICRLNLSLNDNEEISQHLLSHNKEFLLVSIKNNQNSFTLCEAKLFNTKTNEIIYEIPNAITSSGRYKDCYIFKHVFSKNDEFLCVEKSSDKIDLICLKEKRIFTISDASACVFSPDNKFLWIRKVNGTLQVLNLETKQFVDQNSGHFAEFKSFDNCSFIKYSHNGKLLFVNHDKRYDKEVELLDAESFKKIPDVFGIFSNNPHIRNVQNCEFSHNDQFIFLIYDYGNASLIDLETKKAIMDFKDVYCFSFSKTDEFLSIWHSAKMAELIDIKNIKKINQQEKFKESKGLSTIRNHKFSPKNKFILLIDEKNHLIRARLLDMSGNAKSPVFERYLDSKFSHGNKLVFIKTNAFLSKDLCKTVFDIEKQETLVEDYPLYLAIDKSLVLHQDKNDVLELFEMPDDITPEAVRYIDNLLKKRSKEKGFSDLKIEIIE